MLLTTPILFLIFNRPEQTKRVFERIRAVKPKYLFIAADGARPDKAGEDLICLETRTIVNDIDWDCEVKTLFRENNLGCGKAVSGAINWFFENVEEGIILEDDCLPSNDFFAFCEKMLINYKHDYRIMQISGTNSLGEWKSNKQSYHFSYYGSIWGWATWRRAWKYYDFDISLWANKEVQERLKDILVNKPEYSARYDIFNNYFVGKGEDTWDYQWSFARLTQSGLSIVPAVNLVSNIGFGEGATHTLSTDSNLSELPILKFNSSIDFQPFVMIDRDYDRELMFNHGVEDITSTSEVNSTFEAKNFKQRSAAAIISIAKRLIS